MLLRIRWCVSTELDDLSLTMFVLVNKVHIRLLLGDECQHLDFGPWRTFTRM